MGSCGTKPGSQIVGLGRVGVGRRTLRLGRLFLEPELAEACPVLCAWWLRGGGVGMKEEVPGLGACRLVTVFVKVASCFAITFISTFRALSWVEHEQCSEAGFTPGWDTDALAGGGVSVEDIEDSSVGDWGVSDDVGVSGSLVESVGSGSGSDEEGGVLAWGGGCGALEVPAG